MTASGTASYAPSARQVALGALLRVETDGAYANLVLPTMLEATSLGPSDRALATELVYGTIRMRRACDWALGRFREPSELEPSVRNALRLGAYQLLFLQTPPHAAVSTTVDLVAPRARPLLNAVLRRVASAYAGGAARPQWPDEATRLSYPDWIVERLESDLGREQALATLSQMNTAPPVHRRRDGTVQDLASQWVAAHLGASADDRVLDLCAGPGGKTTALGHTGAWVVAGDRSANRCKLVSANARRVGVDDRTAVVGLDGRLPPFREEAFDRVLVDAPCSGLGALRRRPDARWRIQPRDVEVLAGLQRALLAAAAPLVRPGGRLLYAVCTLTAAETVEVDRWAAAELPDLDGPRLDGPPGERWCPPGSGWEPIGRGARLLPHAAGTDGMYVLALSRPERTAR